MEKKSPKLISSTELNRWMQKDDVKPILLDVREYEDLIIAPFSWPVVHLPLSKSEEWLGNLSHQFPMGQAIVVICHAGVRSWNFGTWLLNQDWGYQVWNLDGGIDSWSVHVDSTVPRY